MPKLMIRQKSGDKEYRLGDEPQICGRSNAADITLGDDQASREHCRFEREGGKWFVVDLGSSNGTLVAGERISRHELSDGTAILIGQTSLTFVDPGATALTSEPEPAAELVLEPEAEPAPRSEPAPAELEPEAEAGAAAVAPEPEPKPAAECDLSLRANGGPCDGQTFKISKPVTSIGRSSKCDIMLDEKSVSGRHAEFIVEDGRARIVDKNSRNGVHVNGVHVDERAVDPGDEIRIGSTTFLLLQADDIPVNAFALPEEEAEPSPAAASTVLTPRVKVLALITALILLIAGGVKLLAPSGPSHKVYPDNLLTENPSFEAPAPQGVIAGWQPGKGSIGLSTDDVRDGAQALRLVGAADAGDGISGFCWSAEIDVDPKKVYGLSALTRTPGNEAAALCVAWRSRKTPWLRSLQLGAGQADATAWQRLSEVFEPPSWASRARFGCAVVGPGQAQFDAFLLRSGDRPAGPPRVAAGRLRFESAGRGEFTLFADGLVILSRGRIVALSGGGEASQSLGQLRAGYPDVRSNMVKYVGTLGLEGKAPFSQVISSDGSTATLHYDVAMAALRDPVVALEWRSPANLLSRSVLLRTERGEQITQKTPFEHRGGVTAMTFFSGPKRIFLQCGSPATVSATKAPDDTIDWRLEFSPKTPDGRVRIPLTWRPTSRQAEALIAAELQRAIKAEEEERFGKAVALYEAFIRTHSLYTAELGRAAARLSGVQEEIATQTKRARDLAARATASKSEVDFAAAERTCEALIEKLEGHSEAGKLGQLLAELKRQRKAAVKRQRENEAARFVATAKRHIDAKEFNIARAKLDYVTRKYADTPAAAVARKLLDTLPPAE